MAINIKMPALSPTMETGTLARWLIKEGDQIKPGDIIAEIETDKATMEVTAIDEGTVTRLLVAEGSDDVPVGEIIAVIGEEASTATSNADTGRNKTKAGRISRITDRQPNAPITPGPNNLNAEDRILASPLARRLAQTRKYRYKHRFWHRPWRAHCQS